MCWTNHKCFTCTSPNLLRIWFWNGQCTYRRIIHMIENRFPMHTAIGGFPNTSGSCPHIRYHWITWFSHHRNSPIAIRANKSKRHGCKRFRHKRLCKNSLCTKKANDQIKDKNGLLFHKKLNKYFKINDWI